MSYSERRKLWSEAGPAPKLHTQQDEAIVNGGAADEWHAHCAGLQAAPDRRRRNLFI
jgi:hypothetical protein